MTLFYSHHDRLHGSAGAGHRPLARAIKRVSHALKIIHRAIAAAKIRRLRNELRFHAGVSGDWAQARDGDDATENDGKRYPQRPFFLGDKWAF
jgi:hypothetical protein